MSSPVVECANSIQNDFSLPVTVATVATENGGSNGTNTIIVETYETPKSLPSPSSCTSSPAKQASPPTIISPPCTLTLKSSTSSLMADTESVIEAVDLPPEGLVKLKSLNSESADTTAISSKVDDTPAADLLKWKDMPRHLQFNRYIVEGYRPLTDAKGCVHSLFYFHNETVNILTHGNLSRLVFGFIKVNFPIFRTCFYPIILWFIAGIPVLYILATVPYLLPWDEFRWLSWCHLLGTLAPWCGSFVYHLFMNLDHGEVVYYRLLKLDMFGIWMSQSFG